MDMGEGYFGLTGGSIGTGLGGAGSGGVVFER